MQSSKRSFLKLSAVALGASTIPATRAAPVKTKPSTDLQSIIGDSKPISQAELQARVEKAQAKMRELKIDAIVLEPGSSTLYFSGINWWRSERLTAVIIPKEGEVAVVTPSFEEPSIRQSLMFGDDVRVWNEHQSPFARVVEVLKDRGIKNGKIGIESTVRYFVVNGLQQQDSAYELVSAVKVINACRMIKSNHELALMHKANEVTLRAYEHVYQNLEAGMQPADVVKMMGSAQAALGGSKMWGLALFGLASAYPHGSSDPQEIKQGEIVLMDCGCAVHGYQSDISRTFVFGEANKRQRGVWDTVRRGQQIAFETAQPGMAAGKVDDAVRAYYEKMGYGPGYATPGLSHRTGHGIGMDGHEPINFVHGEKTKLAAGMCLSNEPGLYTFGEFGVRIEDCLYVTEKGPRWFTIPPDDIDEPIGKVADKYFLKTTV